MSFNIFQNISNENKSKAVEKLIEQSSPRPDFFLMVVLSISMATIGMLLNNIVILIGSMLIAPILYPIISTSMGIVMTDKKLIVLSLYTLAKSIALAILASLFLSLLLNQPLTESHDIINKIASRNFLFIYVLVSVISGIAATFSLLEPKRNEALPGAAVAVSFIPPLASIGIGISKLDWDIVSGALWLFLANTTGLIFSSMIIFSLLNFYIKRGLAEDIIKKESSKIISKIEKE